jgi:hypothetical protein
MQHLFLEKFTYDITIDGQVRFVRFKADYFRLFLRKETDKRQTAAYIYATVFRLSASLRRIYIYIYGSKATSMAWAPLVRAACFWRGSHGLGRRCTICLGGFSPSAVETCTMKRENNPPPTTSHTSRGPKAVPKTGLDHRSLYTLSVHFQALGGGF